MSPSFKKRLAETAVSEETTVPYRLDFLFNRPTLHVAPLIHEYNKPLLNDALRRRDAAKAVTPPVPGETPAPTPPPTAEDAASEAKGDENRMIDVMARFGIRGWDDLVDDTDAPVPFSIENARVLLTEASETHRHEVVRLVMFAQNPSHFVKQPRMRAEAIAELAKNS